jgi:hypothetical protein
MSICCQRANVVREAYWAEPAQSALSNDSELRLVVDKAQVRKTCERDAREQQPRNTVLSRLECY